MPVNYHTEFGTTGLRRWGGVLQEEFLRELQGRQGLAVISQMISNDPIIGAVMFGFRTVCRNIDWRIDAYREPGAEATPVDEESAHFVHGCLFEDLNVTWDDQVSETLSFLPYGWAYFEQIYKRRLGPLETDPSRRSKFSDGRIGFRKFAIRAQDTLDGWEFDEAGGIRGMRQVDPNALSTVALIPIEKSLLFRTTTDKGSPEGRSIFRPAYRPWMFKSRIETFEAIGVERDLAGYPRLKVSKDGPDIWNPNDANAVAMKAMCDKFVKSVRMDELMGATLPHWVDFDLLKGSGQKSFNTNEIIARYDTRILMSVLWDVVMLGHGEYGSRSLAGSKMELLGSSIGGFLDIIASVMNRFAIPLLFRLNGWDPSQCPSLAHGRILPRDLEALGQFLTSLTAAGGEVFPNPELMEQLMREVDLPAPPEEAESDEPLPPTRTRPPLLSDRDALDASSDQQGGA